MGAAQRKPARAEKARTGRHQRHGAGWGAVAKRERKEEDYEAPSGWKFNNRQGLGVPKSRRGVVIRECDLRLKSSVFAILFCRRYGISKICNAEVCG